MTFNSCAREIVHKIISVFFSLLYFPLLFFFLLMWTRLIFYTIMIISDAQLFLEFQMESKCFLRNTKRPHCKNTLLHKFFGFMFFFCLFASSTGMKEKSKKTFHIKWLKRKWKDVASVELTGKRYKVERTECFWDFGRREMLKF